MVWSTTRALFLASLRPPYYVRYMPLKLSIFSKHHHLSSSNQDTCENGECKTTKRKPNIVAVSLLSIVFASYLYWSKQSRKFLYVETVFTASQPVVSKKELAKHKSKKDGIWISCHGKVYDVTKFVDSHPGGEKILLAAGGDVKAYWSLYPFHYSDHVQEILNDYYIADLEEGESDELQSPMEGPYASDPERHPALELISRQPCNAEVPHSLIIDKPITPTEIFFVRNHLPVPVIDMKTYRLNLSSPPSTTLSKGINIDLTYDEVKNKIPNYCLVATMVCAGNRRKDMIDEDIRTSSQSGGKRLIRGLAWKHGAISTAEWRGVLLVDLLTRHLLPKGQEANYDELMQLARKANMKHVQFEGFDVDPTGGVFGSSLPVEWALNPDNDVLIAYEMNGETLSRDHGFPFRVIVPGSVGARQVKWLKSIRLSDEESSSFWFQEDYKVAQVDGGGKVPSHHQLPAILDYPVQSAICRPLDGQEVLNEGSLTVQGYAFSGGGRGILSVRVSADGGQTWYEADLHPVSPPGNQSRSNLPRSEAESEDQAADWDSDTRGRSLAHRCKRQWAWTLWEVEVPVPEDSKSAELICVARDSSNAVQPENATAQLNVRGLLTNTWHRVTVTFKDETADEE